MFNEREREKYLAGLALVRDLATKADVIIEGYRPGAMERLGLGPDTLCEANERLIYARMSGWGQTGPLASRAGHDINYLALTGALHPIGPKDGPPTPPVNLVGNFGGGGTFLAMGVLAALLTQMAGWMQMGLWNKGCGDNLLDGSAYFYRAYETADGRHMAVGALEREFHDCFIGGLGLDAADFGDYLNPAVCGGPSGQSSPARPCSFRLVVAAGPGSQILKVALPATRRGRCGAGHFDEFDGLVPLCR